jgi:predicted DNA-binding transcriptional regulator AlpA
MTGPDLAIVPRGSLPPDWEWASSEELAEWLRITLPQLYYLRQQRSAPRGHRLGKQLRFRRRDVELWLATRAEP